MVCKDERIHEWALRHYEKGCIILDTETTGGSFQKDDIIDIALVEFPTGKVLFETFLHSTVSINPFAQKVHKINKQQLVGAPNLTQVWNEIYSHLHNKTVMAYNSNFDQKFLESSAAYRKLVLPKSNWHCIMRAYKDYKMDNKFTNLTEACNELGVKPGTHRASTDALAAARVLFRMAQKY